MRRGSGDVEVYTRFFFVFCFTNYSAIFMCINSLIHFYKIFTLFQI